MPLRVHLHRLVMLPRLRWTAHASDRPKLTSLLLYPERCPNCTLFRGPSDSCALAHEVVAQQEFSRFTIFGNTSVEPDYHHGVQQLVEVTQLNVIRGSAIPEAAVQAVTDGLRQYGWHRTYCQPCYQYLFSPQAASNAAENAFLPPGYAIDRLHPSDAHLVDSLWTFRYPTSLHMIQQLVATQHSSCIRDRDGRLVAWMLEVEPLCGGMLHVLQGHRRQGLARAVCLNLFSKLQSKWVDRCQQADAAMLLGDVSLPAVYCFVVEDNAASIRLMEDVGLHKTGVFTWLGFDKSATPN